MKKSNKTRRMTNESTSIESIQRPETNTVSHPIFIDPAILRKSGLVDSSLELVDSWPLPSVIEISESGTCNRVCSFCPRSSPGYPDIKEFISPLLLQKLLEELAPYSYSGIFDQHILSMARALKRKSCTTTKVRSAYRKKIRILQKSPEN